MAGGRESELERVLEACYAELIEGREPDVRALCGADEALHARVMLLLERERALLDAARSSQDVRASAPQSSDELAAAPVARPDKRGSPFEDFEILEELGRGGMGTVYRARQVSLQRDVALKVLRVEIADHEGARARIQREALVTAALDHENIVPVYASGDAEGSTFLAMKLIRGRPLDDQALPFGARRTAQIGASVARALHAAHEVGVLHRDVKPANILLEKDTPYVVDFGLARLAHATTRLTQGNASPGTLAYMAPELLRERAPTFDPRVDVYGLGATLYEVLSGQPPFHSELQMRLLREVLYEDAPPLRLPAADRDLETIVLRALQKSPSDRFENAQAMALELERFARGDPIESRPISGFARLWRRARRRPLVAASFALSLLMLLDLSASLAIVKLHERELRADDMRRVEQSLKVADLSEGQRAMARLRQRFDDAELKVLAVRLKQEAQVRDAVTALQLIILRSNPSLLEEFIEPLRGRRDGRARLAVATYNALASGTPIELDNELRSLFPRTAVVSDAIRATTSPSAALRACTKDGGPIDRLFAVLQLRTEDRRTATRELNGLADDGPDGFAVILARAIALERDERHQAAFLELGPLVDVDAVRAIASCLRARHATHLGYPQARAMLQDARRAVATDGRRSLRAIGASTELQAFRDLGDSKAFWRVWDASAADLADSKAYWMLGADAAYHSDEFKRAAQILRRGIARLGPNRRRSIVLRGLALWTEWAQKPYATERKLTAEELEEERPKLLAFEERCQKLFEEALLAKERITASEMLLAMAHSAHTRNAREVTWRHLERSCREFATDESLSFFAYMTGYRVLQYYAGQADTQASGGGPLRGACLVAVERAREVLRRAASGVASARRVTVDAKAGLLACSFFAGLAAESLPLALEAAAEKRVFDKNFTALAAHIVSWGGLSLDALCAGDTPSPYISTLVHRAMRVVKSSKLSKDQRRAIYRRWARELRDSPEFEEEVEAIREALRAL